LVRAVLSVHDRSEPPSGPILGNRPRRAHPGHAPCPDARTIWRTPTDPAPAGHRSYPADLQVPGARLPPHRRARPGCSSDPGL